MDQIFCVLFRQVFSYPPQIVQVVRGRVTCSCNVSCHCEFCIKPWAQVPRRWHRSNCWVANTETGNSYFSKLLGCTNDQKLSRVVVQLIIQHPITNIINTAFLSSQSNILVNTGIGAEGQIKLAVICITMNARRMFVHDLKNLARIQYKQ